MKKQGALLPFNLSFKIRRSLLTQSMIYKNVSTAEIKMIAEHLPLQQSNKRRYRMIKLISNTNGQNGCPMHFHLHLHLQLMCFVGYWPFDCTSLNLNPATVLAFTTDSAGQVVPDITRTTLSRVLHLGLLSFQL